MEEVIRQIGSFVVIAALWFYIGYKNGYDKGQLHEQQEMRKRIEIVDSVHKQQQNYGEYKGS